MQYSFFQTNATAVRQWRNQKFVFCCFFLISFYFKVKSACCQWERRRKNAYFFHHIDRALVKNAEKRIVAVLKPQVCHIKARKQHKTNKDNKSNTQSKQNNGGIFASLREGGGSPKARRKELLPQSASLTAPSKREPLPCHPERSEGSSHNGAAGSSRRHVGMPPYGVVVRFSRRAGCPHPAVWHRRDRKAFSGAPGSSRPATEKAPVARLSSCAQRRIPRYSASYRARPGEAVVRGEEARRSERDSGLIRR